MDKTTAAHSKRDPQDGLAWDEQLLDSVPVWTRQPDDDAIRRTCRRPFDLADNNDQTGTCITVSFFASGAFNKL